MEELENKIIKFIRVIYYPENFKDAVILEL
jgi:hypothetical protein